MAVSVIGRRRHGVLRLPGPDRRARRASWLDRDLRARRWALLRRHWLVLLKPLTAFAVVAVMLVWQSRENSLLQGVVIGAYLSAAVLGGSFFLCLLDGTLLARLGRMFERDVGAMLRGTRGVYGVVSGLSFRDCDVDHVVLTPRGVFAVEVKSLLSRRTTWLRVHGRVDKLNQAERGAAKVRALLRSEGVDAAVTPVLVLAGPGTPELRGDEWDAGVRVVAFRDSDVWRAAMAASDGGFDLVTARRVADVLTGFSGVRTRHELHRLRGQPDPATPVRVAAAGR